jgi:hypothetical protein
MLPLHALEKGIGPGAQLGGGEEVIVQIAAAGALQLPAQRAAAAIAVVEIHAAGGAVDGEEVVGAVGRRAAVVA